MMHEMILKHLRSVVNSGMLVPVSLTFGEVQYIIECLEQNAKIREDNLQLQRKLDLLGGDD